MFRYDGYKNLQPSPFIAEINSKLFNYNTMARSATYSKSDGVEYVADPDGYLPDTDW